MKIAQCCLSDTSKNEIDLWDKYFLAWRNIFQRKSTFYEAENLNQPFFSNLASSYWVSFTYITRTNTGPKQFNLPGPIIQQLAP